MKAQSPLPDREGRIFQVTQAVTWKMRRRAAHNPLIIIDTQAANFQNPKAFFKPFNIINQTNYAYRNRIQSP